MALAPPATIAWLVLAACLPAAAERLPARVFDTTHGLPHDRVRRIVADSRGFLWLATAAGLSRFDGERFRTYGIEVGLPSEFVTDVVEAGDGLYWVATEGGVALLRIAAGGPRTEPVAMSVAVGDRWVGALHLDERGNLWAATAAGPLRRPAAGGALEPLPGVAPRAAHDFAEDPQGAVWMATDDGLWRRSLDGRLTHHRIHPAGDRDPVNRLLLDADGTLWMAHEEGLASLDAARPPAGERSPLRWHAGP